MTWFTVMSDVAFGMWSPLDAFDGDVLGEASARGYAERAAIEVTLKWRGPPPPPNGRVEVTEHLPQDARDVTQEVLEGGYAGVYGGR